MDMEMSQCAGGFLPGLIPNPTSDMTRSSMDKDENPEKCEHKEWINRKLHSPWICANHRHGWGNSSMPIWDIMDIAEWYPSSTDCLQPNEGNCLSHAECYDGVALMPLIQTNRVLFSNDGDTAGRRGVNRDDGGSPAGLLGYLSGCLYWSWSLHGMTQCQAKIKGPVVNILSHVIVEDGGLWEIRISATLPVTHAGMEHPPTVIGRRASVGGSVAPSDWPCVLGPADGPPGGIWSGFIRHTVEQGRSIVAVTLTGSLRFPKLLRRRDTDSIYRPPKLYEYCDTAWSLPLLCHTEGEAMDAAGFSIVDNRAGVKFGVELYVPWDAPEMATYLSVKGTVPLRDVQDVIAMCGRRKGVTESRILQGRDARSVRVLVPDCRGLERNFHDVTVVDMGDLPESEVSIPELSDLTRKWPPAVIAHMRWRQPELEEMQQAAKLQIPEEAAGPVWLSLAHHYRVQRSGAICIGTWHAAIWIWLSCGDAQWHGVPCGKVHSRTCWTMYGVPIEYWRNSRVSS